MTTGEFMNKGVRIGVTAAGAVYSCLAVALYVHKVTSVELAANETLRLDRVVNSDSEGFVAEQYKDLIKPGSSTLQLEPGIYHFRSTTDVTLGVDQDVDVVPLPNIKNPWPDPEATASPFDVSRGNGQPDHVPELTVLRRPVDGVDARQG